MEENLLNKEDNYKDINKFSKRAFTVYNKDIMGVKVKFTDLTEEKGLHSHIHTQLTLVLKGKFKFFLDGEEVIVAEGNTLLIESHVEHGCIPLEAESELFDVFVPIREDFLNEMS